MINASEIMLAQLARSLGLDKYAEIMRGDPASPSFQRVFNGYYRIRRNEGRVEKQLLRIVPQGKDGRLQFQSDHHGSFQRDRQCRSLFQFKNAGDD